MKILLADDTEINRLYLGEALTELGADVRTCVDGKAAFDLACVEAFDLLVLDIRMPQFYGDEVLSMLRQRPAAACHQTPAVAVSSEMDADLAKRLLAEGFVAALAKPVRAATVLVAAGFAVNRRSDAVADPTTHDWPEAGAPLQLDDAIALRALGSMQAANRLRGMLAQELRVRVPVLELACAARQHAAMRDWIHQMRASCALCGATRLDFLLLALRAQVLQDDWHAVQDAMQRVRTEITALYALLEVGQA